MSRPTAAPAPAPTTARGRARRRAVVDAAAELFDAVGFHATSMDDVGAAAGISGPGLYRHVASKDDLLIAVFDRLWDRLRPAVEHAATLQPRAAIEALAAAHADMVVDDPAALRLLLRELRSVPDDYQRLAARNHRRWIDAWAAPLATLRPDLDAGRVRTLVLAAHGALDAVATHAEAQQLPVSGADVPAEQRSALAAAALRVLDLP